MSTNQPETQKQISKELDDMFEQMRDPERQDQKELEANHKKNVGQTSKRYGLD